MVDVEFRTQRKIEEVNSRSSQESARKRKLSVDQAESAKQREKKKTMEEEEERVAATHAAQYPYIDHPVRKLQELYVYQDRGLRGRDLGSKILSIWELSFIELMATPNDLMT